MRLDCKRPVEPSIAHNFRADSGAQRYVGRAG